MPRETLLCNTFPADVVAHRPGRTVYRATSSRWARKSASLSLWRTHLRDSASTLRSTQRWRPTRTPVWHSSRLISSLLEPLTGMNRMLNTGAAHWTPINANPTREVICSRPSCTNTLLRSMTERSSWEAPSSLEWTPRLVRILYAT